MNGKSGFRSLREVQELLRQLVQGGPMKPQRTIARRALSAVARCPGCQPMYTTTTTAADQRPLCGAPLVLVCGSTLVVLRCSQTGRIVDITTVYPEGWWA